MTKLQNRTYSRDIFLVETRIKKNMLKRGFIMLLLLYIVELLDAKLVRMLEFGFNFKTKY